MTRHLDPSVMDVLLDGLAGAPRRERAELIAWLFDRGFDLDRISGSLAAPVLLPANRVLGDDGEYVSARQVCESTGVELELLSRLHAAVGLPRIEDPDAAVLLRADAEAAAHAKFFIDMGIDADETVAVMRTLMQSLGHAAAIMREVALKTLLRPDASEVQLAQASEVLARKCVPRIGPMIQELFFVELRHAFETEAVSAAERSASRLLGARRITVTFADIAGFTELGEALAPEELECVASRLAALARDVALPPVRFIKTIGDAVMLVSSEPAPLLHAVLELSAAAAANGVPSLRIGVASGDAVCRAGDWFGSPVNVASRIAQSARPGTVLVAGSARDAAVSDPAFEWQPAGARRFKGVKDDVTLFRVRRPS
jgi:adenylate cyclase